MAGPGSLSHSSSPTSQPQAFLSWLRNMMALSIRPSLPWSRADMTASFQRSWILSSHVLLFNRRHFSQETLPSVCLVHTSTNPWKEQLRLCYLGEANQSGLPQSHAEGWTLRIGSWVGRQACSWFFWDSVFLLHLLRPNTFPLNMGWWEIQFNKYLLCT